MFLDERVNAILPYLQMLAMFSLCTFFLSLILIPWYIGRLPVDYFLVLQQQSPDRRPRSNLGVLVLRNFFGSVLLVAGMLMLFLPGQGILTILIGLLCMAFPGKYQFVLYLISRQSVQRSLNWIRQKMHRPPFRWQK